jgi:phosphate butyryltransferase
MYDPPPSPVLENRTFDELKVGDRASVTRALAAEDLQQCAASPSDLDPAFANEDLVQSAVVRAMWAAGLISAIVAMKLPGPGSIYLGQSLEFLRPVDVGDTITATVVVAAKDPATGRITLDCACANAAGEAVISGQAVVKAPGEKARRPAAAPPGIRFATHDRFRSLLERAKAGPPVPTAVAHPCDAAAMLGVAEAAKTGLIAPILVGPEAKIRAAAVAAGVDVAPFRIEPAPHSHAAAARAVALVRAGEAGLLMKGSLHTDELMEAVVAGEGGLRTERRISHVYLMDVPSYPRFLLVTDAAINIDPDLEAKRDIVQNAIDLAQVIGIERPRVAILSAVETVNPKLRSTLEAAALCKMAERGQITGGLIDGPLAGRADVLVAPDLEAGNILAKQLTFLGAADAAGVVLGARVPIVLTSRADSEPTRLASCAVAVLLARARAPVAPGGPAP